MKIQTNNVLASFWPMLKTSMKLLAAVILTGFTPLAIFAQDSIPVANPSFEQGFVGYPGYGTVPDWPGMTGINDVTGPIWNNGGTVDGTHVGFVEGIVAVGETQTGYQVGQTYWLQFFANARAGETTTPDLYVYQLGSTMGGNLLVPPINIPVSGGTAGSGNPFTFVNIPFTAAASSGLLQIVGLPHGSGNVRYMMDGFSIIQRSTNDVVIANPSFEASGTGQAAPGYETSVAGWTKIGGGQLAINQAGGSFADNGTIPDGGNVLCLTSSAGVSQTLSGLIPGVNYQLSLYVNATAATATPTALINIGGNTAYNGAVTAVSGSNPYQKVIFTFTAAATNATLTILNSTLAATTSTLLVDNVRVIKQADSITVANPSFEQGYVGYPGYGTVPGWAGMTGISDTNGPIWNNGGTVDGSYVGFMEGSILASQTQSGYQVGQTYWLQFFANSRAGEATTPDLYVYQNGSTLGGNLLVPPINIPVSGGAAGSGNPFTFVNIPFTAAVSSGLLQIVGLPHDGSSMIRYLLDGFSIIQRSTNDVVIANPSFEASGTGQTWPGFETNNVAGWTKLGGGNLAINQAGGPFADNGTIPDGGNVLALQNNVGISQVLHGLTAGTTYRLTLYLNERAWDAANALTAAARVIIDGKDAFNGQVSPVGSAGTSNPYLFVSYYFVASAADVTLQIKNKQGNSGSLLVDNVRVVNTLSGSLATSSYADAVLANNPIGYWRFSDGGGTNAFDYVGGNTAIDPNGSPLQAGPQSPAFSGFESTNTAPFMNGTSQGYASTSQLFNGLSSFTLMGWFKIDASQYPIVTDAGHPDGRASLFGQEWAAEFGFYQGTNLYFYGTGISQTIFVTNGFAPGQWNFVAAVSDPAANTTTVYLNGVAAGTASACPGTVNSYLFSIGKNVAYFPSGGVDSAFFPGSIDEVAAFNHALSAASVQDIYLAGTGFKVSIQPQAGEVQVSWPAGHLESAPSVTGPWTTVTGAVSPLSVMSTGAMKFYRAVNP